jgi:transcriptional regulator with XRE-family HTH domain
MTKQGDGMKIGKRIKEIRLLQGLTQEELADRCELSKGFISQIEHDNTSPSISTLVDILTALGTSLDQFFQREKREQVVFSEEDMFVKEDEGSKITWLVPNAQKNDMEPILVELEASATTAQYDPHEGELFGYVLDGMIELVLGDKRMKIQKGESFYILEPSRHHIQAVKKSTFLWVSTPPIF